MKKIYYLLATLFLVVGGAFGQDEKSSFDEDYNPIKKELEDWDPIRGPWLASSLNAMSNNEPVPDRTFPEDLTPAQMVALLPEDTRSSMERVVLESSSNGSAADQARWQSIRTVIVRPGAGCTKLTARTYGEPHLVTFDGARYSFQTVGEFVLAKSTGGIEIQSRQKAIRDDFSVNTAIAMNVGGDRVGIYASDAPNGNSSTPVRVNGQPVHVTPGNAYFLANGGTITRSGKTYKVSWPTGEVVQTRFHGWFMNDVTVQITECSEGTFDGLLGDANGNSFDDFRGDNTIAGVDFPRSGGVLGGNSRIVEQQRLAYLASTLGDRYRVTNQTSLFDYSIGESTETFTDRFFPRVHRTINEIPQDRRDAARRRCEQSGISRLDMEGCVFDNAYLDMDPEPAPVVEDPSRGITLAPLDSEVENVNPERPIEDVQQVDDKVSSGSKYTPLPLPQQEQTGKGGKEIKDINNVDSPNTDNTKEVRTSPGKLTPMPVEQSTRTEKPSNVGGFFGGNSSGSESTRSTPTQSTPTRSTPTRSTPTRSTPTRSTPTRSTPTRSTPTRSTPTRTTPTRSTPTRSTPTKSKPPVRTAPKPSTPTRSGSRGG
ncbi:MAG: VWD domain-containing protein [Crocinitomicaceae bacterium]|nr:VWD domain-containing protein [Crocinitomicaceae bacterium]